jgi:glycosyltransferase involved in cell wall biosynthesis
LDTSVICPVFNTDPVLLKAAIRSVLDQSGSHALELIVVDDRSTRAETHAVLRDAAASDSRVRVLYQSRNTGPGQARAAGISQAAYDWIGFIDSDDLWPKSKLDQARAALQERPDSRWIGGNYATLFPDGEQRPARRLTPPSPATEAGPSVHRLAAPDLTRLLIGDWLPLGVSLVRKDLIAAVGGFNPRLLYGEDWLLCLRLSTLAPMDFLETPTYVLNRRGASMMHSTGRLSAELARSARMARRDPTLRPVRRELRWFCYNTYKDAAMNNALNGRKLKGLSFALLALSVDPRELRDLLLFLRLLPANGRALAEGLRRYSTSEQIVLAQLAKDAGFVSPEAGA